MHVGTMKSATTYLQELAQLNATRLAAQGVLWPPADLPFLALAELLGRDTDRPGHAGSWSQLVESFQRHGGTAVLSNELLAPVGRRTIATITQALAPAEIKVVITARDLGRVIPSHWQTTLKNGATTSWAAFAQAVCADPATRANVARSRDTGSWFWRRHDVARIVERWSRRVPARHITVVTVPPPGADARLVGERFATALGVCTTGFAEPSHDNSSVGAYSAELLRRLNATHPGFERHHFRWGVKEALVRAGLAEWAAREPGFGLSEQQHAWVRRRADRMIAELQAMGVSVVGDLDDLRPGDVPAPRAVDPESAIDADLVLAALHGIGGLAEVIADLQVERERTLTGDDTSRGR